MPEKDHAAQLYCIGGTPVGQMREVVQQLAITKCPVEDMSHHLHDMQVIPFSKQQGTLFVCLISCSAQLLGVANQTIK